MKHSSFTDCESCTRPISTNPVSMEAGEYGLTRGTCFVAHRLEGVAVAGCCGFRGVFWVGRIFSGCVFSFCFFFFERARPAASMRPPCLIYLSTSMGRETALNDVCASLQSRRGSLPADPRLDHARSQLPCAVAIPSRGMAIARRTATPASGTVRSAGRRQDFCMASRTVPFFIFRPRVSFFFFSSEVPSRTRTCSHQE